MNSSSTDRPWPALVQSGEKAVAALMNRKAFRKSLENNSPWIVHPQSGRVLPWPGSPALVSLKEEAGYYALEIAPDAQMNPYGTALPPDVNPDSREGMRPSSKKDGSGIIMRLVELISERRQQMAEGSYTSHLFESGADKIRKKIGEEAVELVLARSNDDIIYETADLLYHILVFLEAVDLDWLDVESELERRLSS